MKRSRPEIFDDLDSSHAVALFSSLSFEDLDETGEKSRLLADFEFRLSYLGGGFVITVPRNFVTDWASVPWYLRWILLRRKFGRRGPLIHDYLYRLEGFPRFLADAIFRTVMAYDSIPLHRRVLAFWAVRLLGWACKKGSKR